MSILFSALITFFVVVLLVSHLEQQTIRRFAGYAGWCDLILHGLILYMFLGTSTDGLMQAEAAGIMFSLTLRGYRHFKGYERRIDGTWMRFAGSMT